MSMRSSTNGELRNCAVDVSVLYTIALDEGSVGLREAFSAMRWETRHVKGIKDMFYYVSVFICCVLS